MAGRGETSSDEGVLVEGGEAFGGGGDREI